MKYLVLIILFFAAGPLHAQWLKGTVTESANGDRIGKVFIRDMTTKEVTLSDKRGNFDIKTQPGHTLIFSSPGYVSDTLYITDMDFKPVKLLVQGITLNQVNILSTRSSFDPRIEYADVYRKSKVYVMSPSTWFSREGKNARRLKQFFAQEEKERHIDSVFSRVYVSTLIPLRGRELEDFMTLYRPTYAYVINNNGPSLAVYINDAYKKFKALPPEKRTVQSLTP